MTKDRQDHYLFLQPQRAPCPCIVDEPALWRSSGGVLSSGPPWTKAPPGLRVVDPVHRLFLLKKNSISYKFQEFYTKAPVFCSNYILALGFIFYLMSSPVQLQSSPYNFKTSYLFNRNSVLSDFCAKSFVATKPIYPLHHIHIPLFAVLFDLVCSLACFMARQSSSRE
jgi:hypothetical protein